MLKGAGSCQPGSRYDQRGKALCRAEGQWSGRGISTYRGTDYAVRRLQKGYGGSPNSTAISHLGNSLLPAHHVVAPFLTRRDKIRCYSLRKKLVARHARGFGTSRTTGTNSDGDEDA